MLSVSPEKAGISSKAVKNYLDYLDYCGLATHGVIMMKGNDIFCEKYWEPFNKDFCHRMYSQTKSFVGIAIGLLEEEGKLSLDDLICEHFPEKIYTQTAENLKKQTIRDMLTMQTVDTGKTCWFTAEENDRTRLYLNDVHSNRPAGAVWEYDSPGTQVLSALAEKLSGKSLFDYLKEKLFDKMGTFKTATILKTRTEDSWGDSAMLCTVRDIASFGRLLMQNGTWNGEQLINENFVKKATSKICDNSSTGFSDAFEQGYGYYIWRTKNDGFAFVGMGDQLTLCFPKQDLLFSITSDNQGYAPSRQLIVNGFIHQIANVISDKPIDEDEVSYKDLLNKKYSLCCLEGDIQSPLKDKINLEKYFCEENRTGITEFSFEFISDNHGIFRYKNKQGDKELHFGLGENRFGSFPELGYSNDHGGSVTTDGFKYKCAVSAAFKDEHKFVIKTQIIDRYFANATFVFCFKDKYCHVKMVKTAEHFLEEYYGSFMAETK